MNLKAGDMVYYVCNFGGGFITSFKLVSVGKSYSKLLIPATPTNTKWIKTVSNDSIATTPEQAFEQFRDEQLRKIESRVKKEINSYIQKNEKLKNMKMFEVK